MNLLNYPSLPYFNYLKQSWVTSLDSWILFNPMMQLIWKQTKKKFDITKRCWYLYAYGKGLTIWAGVSGGKTNFKKTLEITFLLQHENLSVNSFPISSCHKHLKFSSPVTHSPLTAREKPQFGFITWKNIEMKTQQRLVRWLPWTGCQGDKGLHVYDKWA